MPEKSSQVTYSRGSRRNANRGLATERAALKSPLSHEKGAKKSFVFRPISQHPPVRMMPFHAVHSRKKFNTPSASAPVVAPTVKGAATPMNAQAQMARMLGDSGTGSGNSPKHKGPMIAVGVVILLLLAFFAWYFMRRRPGSGSKYFY